MKQGFIFDIDGTLVFDGKPLPGAIKTIEFLRSKNKVIRFATNGTGKTQEEIATFLQTLGFTVFAHEVETSVTACIRYLNRVFPNNVGQFLLPDRTLRMFRDFKTDHVNPEYIVLGDLDDAFTYPLLNDVFQKMFTGIPVIVFHRNTKFRQQERYSLDSGAFTIALEQATGKTAVVTGKPSKVFFEEIYSTMKLPKSDVLVVGDDVQTDIQGAKNAGIDAALVKTGKYLVNPPGDIEPWRVLEKLENLRAE